MTEPSEARGGAAPADGEDVKDDVKDVVAKQPTRRATRPPALEANRLGRRYRRRWALRDCTFRLPPGRVCALVGANGSGKSTLLALAGGLLRPSTGTVRLCGGDPADPAARRRVSLVTQNKPLYPGFTVAETLRLGRELNRGWDQAAAETVLREVEVPLRARVGRLSGGQRTCVALALALGRHPEVLLLDEPMSDLDPLRRHVIRGLLMAEAAEHGTTVVISSHHLTELEGVCDYLVMLDRGSVRIADEIDFILAAHTLVTCARDTAALPEELLHHTVIETRGRGRQLRALVRLATPLGDHWDVEPPSLEEILLAYLRRPEAPPLLAPEARAADPDAVPAEVR